MDAITVITLTRARPKLLRRAIRSVRSQDYAGDIEHLIVVDDCGDTAEMLRGVDDLPRRRLTTRFEARAPGDVPEGSPGIGAVYPRIARLLNRAVGLADSRWIAFLDDDNEYEPDHLGSLMDCALETGCSAVHSFRKIFNADGTPYLERRFPWVPDPEEGARIYELLCSRDVWVRGSNILKDRAEPMGADFRNSTVISSSDPVLLVDTSVWLVARSLLRRCPIPEEFSEQDIRDRTAPDDKFLEVLLREGVPIATSERPTLRYYLGGISNRWTGRPAGGGSIGEATSHTAIEEH